MRARIVLAAIGCLWALAGCAPESVKTVVLSPATPEIEAVLQVADARWEAAGIDHDRIQIGPDGALVTLVPERGDTSETRVFKQGHAFKGVRWMELNSLDAGMVMHEIGHALGIDFHPDALDAQGVADCAADASNRPLMCSHVGQAIAARDLTDACDSGDCTHFTPETD